MHLRQGMRVVLQDERGLQGFGEAAPLKGQGVETLEETKLALEIKQRCIRQQEFQDLSRSQQGLLKADSRWEEWLRPLERRPCARFAIELATLDLCARREGVSLARLLHPGGESRLPVGAVLVRDEVADLVKDAQERLKEGFGCLKVKLGSDIKQAESQLRGLREAVGSAAIIRGDARGAWKVSHALGYLQRLMPWGLEYIEQPVATEEWLKHPELREQSPIPLALDDASLDDEGMKRVIGEKIMDVLVLKPHFMGGMLRSLSWAEQALGAGIPVVVTTALDGVVGRLGAVHAACVVEAMRKQTKLPIHAHGLGSGVLMREDLAKDPCLFQDGFIQLPGTDGIGLSKIAI